MLKQVYTVLIFASVLIIGINLNAQTVQAGISLSGTSLVISAQPNLAVSGNFSGGNITITWPTSYGVTLGGITNVVGSWFVNNSGTFNSTTEYVNFAHILPVSAINWSGGSINELFRVAVNQTGTGTGTFTLSNNVPDATGNWYFEVTDPGPPPLLHDYTNTSTPFYTPSVGGVPLPVELSSFTASTNQSAVNLKWQTKTEVNNYGFEVERSLTPTPSQREGTFNWEKIGFVNGNGNSNTPKDYSLTDKNPVGGSKFVYRLKQIDNDGKHEYSKEVEVEIVPNEFNLYQNYPNPFNPSTNIKFALPKAAKVTLLVYNLLGEKITTLLDEDKEAGFYNVQFNASNLSTGVYIYRLSTGDFVQTKKMTLIK